MTVPASSPASDSQPRPPERWFAGLVLLVLAMFGIALPAGGGGSSANGLRSDGRHAEAAAPFRALALSEARASEERTLPPRDRDADDGPDVPPSGHSDRTAAFAPMSVPAVVADIPRRSVRSGPRQPTGPPLQV